MTKSSLLHFLADFIKYIKLKAPDKQQYNRKCYISFQGAYNMIKLTSHDILHYLCSADLSKKLFSIGCVNIYLFSIVFSIDFARWKSVG